MPVTLSGNLEINTGVAKRADSPAVRPVRRMAPIEPFSDEAVAEEVSPGLPLVLARPALVADDVTIDSLSEAQFKQVHPDMDAMDVPGARYGLRILREGYLYVVDENQGNKISAYGITQNNFFRPFDPAGEASPGDDIGSRVITIDDPENATKPVWFAFSDVEWTEALVEAHKSDCELREKHMVKFDVQQWMNEQQHEGAFAVTTLRNCILEMNPGRKNARKMEWSPAAVVRGDWFSTRNVITRAMRRRSQSDLPRVRAAALMLPDPVGFASDLEALMQYRAATFLDDKSPDYSRKTSLAASIDELEFAIREKGEDSFTFKNEVEATQWEFPLRNGLGPGRDRPADPERARMIRGSLTPDALDDAADQAWGKYISRFDTGAWQDWTETVRNDFSAMNDALIVPMAQAHRSWMESAQLGQYLEGNYDPEDPQSGEAYVGVISLCIGSSQDKGACFDLYSEWLESDDDNNPLRRALAYNQQGLRDGVKEALNGEADWHGLPWDRLFFLFSEVTANLPAGRSDLITQLVIQVMGPLEKLVAKAAANERVYSSLAMLGALRGQPFVLVEVSGHSRQFWSLLTSEMARLSGEPVDEVRLRRAVNRRLARLTARGVSMESAVTNRWLLMIDPQAVDNMPSSLRGEGQLQARAGWLSQHIKTPEDVEQIRFNTWREGAEVRSKTALRAGMPIGLGLLGLMTSFVAISGMHSDLMRAMAHQRAEVVRRLAAQYTQMVGAFGELVGKAMEVLGRRPLAIARALRLNRVGVIVGKGFRVVGVIGGAVMAALDFAQGWREYQEGNYIKSSGYVVAGMLGVAFLVLLAVKAFVWATIAFIVSFVLALVLDWAREDNIQQWLDRTIWGKRENSRYENEEIEQQELQKALGMK